MARPVILDLPYAEPADAAALWRDAPHMALLDSAGPIEERSRYAYLAVEPVSVVEARDGQVFQDGNPVPDDPFTAVERALARHPPAPKDAPVPFAGGAIGFFGYELGRHLDPQPVRHPDDLGIPELSVGFYDTVLAFDRQERRAWAIGPEEKASRLGRRLADARPVAPAPRSAGCWTADLDRDAYQARVAGLQRHIAAGDIFQANFTSRFTAPRPADSHGFDLYRRLRAASPTPFAAYLACGPRLTLASASPERFLRLDPDGRVETRPIKGTRPRGADPATDANLKAELTASAKDRAENLMIVDLLRNDLGRVAEIGSVGVPSLLAVESFASVHHLVSSVEACLRPGVGPIGLLRACFPGGSITGAPKIRAMALIDAAETCRRGPYCGAIAWIGTDGAMDSSIVIRTLLITPERLVAQAGGGIVADSDPAAEYEEMMVKIRPLLGVLDQDGTP
jgi:para-aminobenzoate synthetase component 1